MKRLPGIKAGAPFLAYADFSVAGVPEVFPASDLGAQFRDRAGRILANAAITSDATVVGRYWLSVPGTAHWTPGDVFFDIYRAGSDAPYTETIAVPVERAQTRVASPTMPDIVDIAATVPVVPGPLQPLGLGAGPAAARVVLGAPGAVHTVVIGIPVRVPIGAAGPLPEKIVTTEDLEPGDYLHLYREAGELRVRKTSALLGFEAHAFTRDACAAGTEATVCGIGDINAAVGDVLPGPRWLSTVAGKCQASAPQRLTGVRVLVQRVGVAHSATAVRFQPGDVLRLAST